MKIKGIGRLVAGTTFLVATVGLLTILGGRLLRTEVTVAPVARGTAVRAVPGVVRIAAERTMEVRAETDGRVLLNQVEVGDRVEAGDVLLRLDDSELLRALARVRLDLEAEEALREVGSLLRYDIEEARDDLARKEELHDKGQFSRRDLDLQRRRLARLEDEAKLEEIRDRQRLQGLRSELDRLEDEVSRTTIRAPGAGHVVEVFAHAGDLVGPRVPMARLLSEERLIEATLSEENFAGVRAGQPAKVRFLSYGSQLFPAEVAKVLPAADPETQRYAVHLDVDMVQEMMVPGLTGEVSIVLGEREDSLIIPRRALVGREVFVVREGRVEVQQVQTGFVSLNHVEILSGLEEGDQVAVENLDRLRDGDWVRVKAPSTANKHG